MGKTQELEPQVAVGAASSEDDVPGRAALARWRARDQGLRLWNRVVARRYDRELAQLRSLQRAYAGKTGPEVLVVGDSMMTYVPKRDDDRRRLEHMVRDEMPGRPRVFTIAGPAYNPRLIMAFLDVLAQTRSKPRAIVVPTFPTTSMDVWLHHPRLCYEGAAEQVKAAAAGSGARRLVPASMDEWAKYDARPLQSFTNHPRTGADLLLITNSRGTTPTQKEARVRQLMDCYYAERLVPDGPGPRGITEMGRQLRETGIPSLSYLGPLDVERVTSFFGPGIPDHMEKNAEVLRQAFAAGVGDAGVTVDRTMGHPSADFCDPIHLRARGRRGLARDIAGSLAELL